MTFQVCFQGDIRNHILGLLGLLTTQETKESLEPGEEKEFPGMALGGQCHTVPTHAECILPLQRVLFMSPTFGDQGLTQ